MKREIEDCKWFHSIRLSPALFMLIKMARGSSRRKKRREWNRSRVWVHLSYIFLVPSLRNVNYFHSKHVQVASSWFPDCVRSTRADQRQGEERYQRFTVLAADFSLFFRLTFPSPTCFLVLFFFFLRAVLLVVKLSRFSFFFSVFIANKHSLEQRRESSALCVSSSNGNNSSAI